MQRLQHKSRVNVMVANSRLIDSNKNISRVSIFPLNPNKWAYLHKPPISSPFHVGNSVAGLQFFFPTFLVQAWLKIPATIQFVAALAHFRQSRARATVVYQFACVIWQKRSIHSCKQKMVIKTKNFIIWPSNAKKLEEHKIWYVSV